MNLYVFGRQRAKEEYDRLSEEAKKEYDRLNEEARDTKKQLRSSLADIQASDVRVQELTETLSDPVKIFSNHLRTISESFDKMQTRLHAAINRAGTEAQDLSEKRRHLCREPNLRDELIVLLQQASLTLEGHRNRINEHGAFIRQLSEQSNALRQPEPVGQNREIRRPCRLHRSSLYPSDTRREVVSTT